jgi:xylulokinase
MAFVLGLDLGTSSLKGLVLNEKGELIGQASSDYPLEHAQAGYSEQNPAYWVAACDTVLFELSKSIPDFKAQLAGISFSGQMHSLVVLNQENQVLRNAILWNDVRTTQECNDIATKLGGKLIDITKNRALEGFTLPKILWLQKHEPQIWQQVKHILLPKDYLGFYLTGNQFMDLSDAAGTLLLDVANKTWSNEIINAFNIDKNILPTLCVSTHQTGVLSDSLKTKFGFENDVKVFAGAADNAAAAVGAGILDESIALASIGTSGVFLSYEGNKQANYQGKLHFFNHAIADTYYSMGVTLAAGNSLNWFRDTFAPNNDFKNLLHNLNDIKTDGLIFTPYIVGERTPYADSKIRGSFLGIDTHHTLKHFTKAVIEGITFSLKDSQMIMETSSSKVFNKIISVGGGAKSSSWLQMQADIFDADIITLKAEQGPGLGAAMFAAVGLGWFATLQEASAIFVAYNEPVKPIAENVRYYQKLYMVYNQVYNATKDLSHKLQDLQAK